MRRIGRLAEALLLVTLHELEQRLQRVLHVVDRRASISMLLEELGDRRKREVRRLNVRHVLLVGPVAEFGDDWLGEVRQAARSSVMGLFARDTQIDFGHVHEDVVVLGASALLMEQQLGLGLAR